MQYTHINNNKKNVLGYFSVNVLGVWFYNLTPIIVYFYRVWQGQDAQVGFVWVSWYPFDKHQPFAHVAVYLFEIFAGKKDIIYFFSFIFLSSVFFLY